MLLQLGIGSEAINCSCRFFRHDIVLAITMVASGLGRENGSETIKILEVDDTLECWRGNFEECLWRGVCCDCG